MFTFINTLETLARDPDIKAKLGYLIQQIQEYIYGHFRHEEELIKAHAPEQLAEQITTHQDFANNIERWVNKLAKENIDLQIQTVELSNFLFNWLIDHIHGVDKKYAGLLK